MPANPLPANHLYDRLTHAWQNHDAQALVTPGGRAITFAQLTEQSSRFANALNANGVKPGDRVAAQIDKSPDAISLYLACVRAGAVYLPLNTSYTPNEIAYFVDDAKPTVFIARPEHEEALQSLCRKNSVPTCLTLGSDQTGTLYQAADQADGTFQNVPRATHDLAAILYTSGTTGRSKGAMLTHENLASNAKALMNCWQFTANDRFIHALPIYHVHGLFVAINVVLMSAASMIFLEHFDPDEIIKQLPNATALMGVPTFYTRLLAEDRLTRDVCTNMRVFISGSAPLLAETHREFEQRTGHAIVERYGLTETGINTSNPCDGERRPGSVGLPFSGVELRLTNPETQTPLRQVELTDPKTVGMIEVRGPNVFSGYWNKPEKTQEEIRGDGFFITGDLGRLDKDGYLHIVGRAKDLVISGGLNIYPKEIEAEIDSVAGIDESAVIGLPHKDLGEAVTALVVCTTSSTRQNVSHAPTHETILAELKRRLAPYKVPRKIIFIDALPRNTMGKVQKNLLREEYADLYQQT